MNWEIDGNDYLHKVSIMQNSKLILLVFFVYLSSYPVYAEALIETTKNTPMLREQNLPIENKLGEFGLANQDFTNFTLEYGTVQTRLMVPTKFMNTDYSDAVDNHGEYIKLKMLWPNLASTKVRFGIFDQQQYNDEQALLESGHVFNITFTQMPKSGRDTIVQYHLKNDWVPLLEFSHIADFDQYIVSYEKKRIVQNKQLGMRYLIPSVGLYKYTVYFDCPINSPFEPIGLYCQGHTIVHNNVVAEYMFSFAHLSEWKKIDETVRDIFSHMIIN